MSQWQNTIYIKFIDGSAQIKPITGGLLTFRDIIGRVHEMHSTPHPDGHLLYAGGLCPPDELISGRLKPGADPLFHYVNKPVAAAPAEDSQSLPTDCEIDTIYQTCKKGVENIDYQIKTFKEASETNACNEALSVYAHRSLSVFARGIVSIDDFEQLSETCIAADKQKYRAKLQTNCKRLTNWIEMRRSHLKRTLELYLKRKISTTVEQNKCLLKLFNDDGISFSILLHAFDDIIEEYVLRLRTDKMMNISKQKFDELVAFVVTDLTNSTIH